VHWHADSSFRTGKRVRQEEASHSKHLLSSSCGAARHQSSVRGRSLCPRAPKQSSRFGGGHASRQLHASKHDCAFLLIFKCCICPLTQANVPIILEAQPLFSTLFGSTKAQCKPVQLFNNCTVAEKRSFTIHQHHSIVDADMKFRKVQNPVTLCRNAMTA
jgi:hypothetical protein